MVGLCLYYLPFLLCLYSPFSLLFILPYFIFPHAEPLLILHIALFFSSNFQKYNLKKHLIWLILFKSGSLCNQINLILEWMSEWSCLVMADSLRPHGLWPIRLLHPWDFPSKNTGLDCHFLLHNIGIGHVKREEWQKKRSDGNRDKIHHTNLPK